MNIEQMFVSFCFVSFVLHTGGGVKHITNEAGRTQMYFGSIEDDIDHMNFISFWLAFFGYMD